MGTSVTRTLCWDITASLVGVAVALDIQHCIKPVTYPSLVQFQIYGKLLLMNSFSFLDASITVMRSSVTHDVSIILEKL
jgi:hypothetical protein